MTNYQFRKSLAVGMAKLGYEKVISELADAHFIKRLENGFYITLFLYHHRFDKGAYTANFHLDYYASFGFIGGEQRLSRRNRGVCRHK